MTDFPDHKDIAYYDAILEVCNHYREMIRERIGWDGWPKWMEIYNFMVDLEKGCKDMQPLCKMNRWLGYIQGVLIERGLTTVEAERDFTRSYFRPLDFGENNGTQVEGTSESS